MNNRKIHVITKYFYPVAAGIETNILETYSILVKNGWDVTIHTSRDTLLLKNSLVKKEIIRGLKIERYQYSYDLWGFYPNIDWNNGGIIALHNFNVFYWRILFKTLLLKITGRKKFILVLTPHGGFNPEWSMFSVFTRMAKYVYHYAFGSILINHVVDKVRVVSDWEKQQIIKVNVNAKKVRMITNGIEDVAYKNIDKLISSFAKKTVKSVGKYIIQVGRIYPIKNYETVIKALPYIPKHIKYVIVGQEERNTEYKKSLISLAHKLGVADRVIFLGVLRGVDKYFVIKHALMMVHMALWESFCNVVHEGLSQGLVCIVANNTALPCLVRNGVNGYCIATNDHIEVAKKVNFILKNKSTHFVKNMENRNRMSGLENSWKKVAEKVDILYAKTLP